MALMYWINKKIKKHYDWKMVAATESYSFFFGLFIASLFPNLILYSEPWVYGVLFLTCATYPLYIWFSNK